MLSCDPGTRPAVEAFRALLDEDPAGTRQQLARVREQLVEKRLLYGDNALPLCFAPAIITRSRLAPIREQLNRLMRVLLKLEKKLQDPHWLDWLKILPAEQELIGIPSGLKQGRAISRVDGFLGPQNNGDTGYRLVELNVDSPGGGAFMDICARLLRRTESWKRFTAKYPGRYLATDGRVLDYLLDCWHDWGGQGKPRIAIVDWITVSTVEEFEVLRQRFVARGVDTIVADPRELEFKDGRLRCYDGIPIDLVYRRVLVEDLLAQAESAQAMLQAYRAGAVCVVNPFSVKPLTVKTLLALLYDSEGEKLLSGSELAFLRSLIPWTARVEPDGLEDLARRRQELVLKPADSWGAQGLHLGWTMSQSEWETALQEAVAGSYVAQQRVLIPQESFPVATDNGWDFHAFRVDFAPYMFGAGLADPLVRMAASEVLNVKAGAQIAVTWILDQ